MLKPLVWVGSIALAGMLGYSGHSVSSAFGEMTKQQQALNQQLLMFKATYESLQDVERRWTETYKVVPPDIDVLRFHRMIGLNRFSNTPPDGITVKSVEPVENNGTVMPLYEVCVTNDQNSFVMQTVDLVSAIAQLRRIAAQPDMTFDGLSVTNANNRVEITLSGLCMLVRTEDDAGRI